MNRRTLLQLAAALAGGTVIPAGGTDAPLRNVFRDPELLAALGSRCATDLPAGRTALIALAGLGNAADNQTRLQRFAAQRRADFRDGRIVTVDGWVMARSEAALCALIARS